MGLAEAEAAMLALESAKGFDYKKVPHYESKLRQYAAEKTSLFPDRPALFDVTEGRVTIPEELNIRIEEWMRSHLEYSPFMRTFATHYLACLLDDIGNSLMYRHIADCVEEGGDFYVESGMFYLRDAAAVSAVAE